ncbi:EF-hand domain pair [Phytophthora cactorum]|nr:EF-hand domain pair [Phytophthora cactorum]
MASKYAKPMEIPANFPDVLRNFTREVLRQQGKVETKEAIYAFGIAVFQGPNREAKRDEYGIAAFNEAQQQDGGMVVYEQFKQGSKRYCSFVQLIPNDWHVSLLSANVRRNCFLHGMMQDEMESIVRETFQRADKDEIGALNRLAFMDALRDADLGLTRREVNILMSEAPVAEDDTNIIVYPDFVPICFPLLKDTYVQGILEAHSNPDWIAQYLTEVFASGDSENTGLLTVAEIARLFRAADVGLTRLQIIAVMAEAQEDNTGFVNYEKFASQISGMVLALTNVDSQQTYAAYLQKYRKTSEYYTVLDLNQHTFEQALSRALEAVDESHRGVLVRDEVIGATRNAFPEITDRQLRSLLALSDPDEMGELDYNLITHSAFQALQKLQEYDMMIAEP